MHRANHVLRAKLAGLEADDLVDCSWRDLYTEIHDMRGDEFDKAVMECAAEYNDFPDGLDDEDYEDEQEDPFDVE